VFDASPAKLCKTFMVLETAFRVGGHIVYFGIKVGSSSAIAKNLETVHTI